MTSRKIKSAAVYLTASDVTKADRTPQCTTMNVPNAAPAVAPMLTATLSIATGIVLSSPASLDVMIGLATETAAGKTPPSPHAIPSISMALSGVAR